MNKLEIEDTSKIANLPYDWEKLRNKTIMISGGTGFIGSFIIDVIRYRNQYYNMNTKVISVSRNGGVSNETVAYLKKDICLPINYEDNIDFIVHLASNTHPQQYGSDPVGTILTNVYGCNNLLNLARNKKARFLLASSVEIYGQGTDIPMDESYSGYINCNTARSGYNEAKRISESLCQSYKEQYDVDVVIARLSRVFGADKKRDTKAMAQFMDKAILGEDIVIKSKGNQRFSYCYVADAASGILKILLEGRNGEVYNVSDDDDGMTLGGYAEYIASLAGKRVIFDIEECKSVSSASYAILDTSKIKELGWYPRYTVKEGLRRTYLIKSVE